MKDSTKKILIVLMCAVCMIGIIGISVWVNIDRHLPDKPSDTDVTVNDPAKPDVNKPNEPGNTTDDKGDNSSDTTDETEPEEEKPLTKDEIKSQYFRRNLEPTGDRIITMESRQAYIDSIALNVTVVEEIHELPAGTDGGGFHLKFDGKMMYGIRILRYYLDDGTEIVLKDVTENLDLTDRDSWPGIVFTDYHNEYRLVNMSTSVFLPNKDEAPTMSVCTDEQYQAYMQVFGEFIEDTWNEKWNDIAKYCLCSITDFEYDEKNKVVLAEFSTTLEGLQADGVEIQIFNADGTLVEEYDFEDIKSTYSFNLEDKYNEYLFIRARLYMDGIDGRLYNYYCKAIRVDGLTENDQLFE